MVIYLGISDYIGGQRGVQSSKGAMLTHVVEKKEWTTPKECRHGIHTNDYLVSLFATQLTFLLNSNSLSTPTWGQRSLLFRFEIVPQLVEEPALRRFRTFMTISWQPIRWLYTRWQSPIGPSEGMVQTRVCSIFIDLTICHSSSKGFVLYPLLQYHGGHLMFSSDPARIGPREGNRAPPLTLEQEMALAVLQNVAAKHQVKLDHCAGDLIYFNNWSLLHAREAYQDGEASSRHLIRLWLRNAALAWPVPDSMNLPWDCAFGMRSKRILNHSYPIVPMPQYVSTTNITTCPFYRYLGKHAGEFKFEMGD